ncbi:hypothetical protein [Pelotomaculum propionicicum]|uniref:DUF2325 domain-containing protein n=1 Tax=Pelotomaculum propionicicum TaxID=258475 RepID=A0A4Y7RQ40_9FIRM|nr:hypothetical protein [Pelotomaculum propionicicum]NLI12067.1 hypothetical protein [Peptococcaceae bacterium]TEB10387.1 hypothetical protein Pmgp_02399 [Pelotomaculum propionicicum]
MVLISKVTIDFMPFLLEAFGQEKKTYHDLDKIYKEMGAGLYKLAEASEYYHHPIVREGTTQQEEYAKKTLGILLYLEKTNDNEIWTRLFGIIKKVWPNILIYLENNECIHIEEYFAGRMDYLKSSGRVNTETIILLWMANVLGKEIKRDHLFNAVGYVLVERLMLRNKNNTKVFCRRNMERPLLKNIRELKSRIRDKYGDINNLNSVFKVGDKELTKHIYFFEKLNDTEEMSINRIFENLEISNRDVEEILGAYITEFDGKDTSEAAKYLVSGFMLKGLIKAYKDAKEYYFERNKDLVPVDTESYKKAIAAVAGERDYHKAQAKKLAGQVAELKDNLEELHTRKIADMEKRIKELERRLVLEKEKEKELVELRNLMFSLSNENIQPESGMSQGPDLSRVNVAVAGGFERWQKKIKERYPNFVFIASENFDVRLLDGIDHVFIFARHIGHKLYYRIISEVRKRGIPISYVSKVNEDLAVKEIKNALTG